MMSNRYIGAFRYNRKVITTSEKADRNSRKSGSCLVFDSIVISWQFGQTAKGFYFMCVGRSFNLSLHYGNIPPSQFMPSSVLA